MDLHLAYGDAAVFLGVEPRFSVVDAIENTHRLDAAFFKGLVVKSKARPRRPRVARARRRHRGRGASRAAGVCGDALPLRVPRRAAFRRGRARLARCVADDADRGQPGTADRSQRRAHCRRRFASATARSGWSRHQPLRHARRSARGRRARRRIAGLGHGAQRLPGGADRRSTRAGRWCSTMTSKLAPVVPGASRFDLVGAAWRGVEPTRRAADRLFGADRRNMIVRRAAL